MTTQERTTLRAVILPAGPLPGVTAKLLNDLGHDVTPASSPDQARRLLESEPTDLLVVDMSNSRENQQFVQELNDLPASQRPRELAIFSDWIDETLQSLRKRVAPSHVHVFLKPLHVHGLLNVLRQMDAESADAATA